MTEGKALGDTAHIVFHHIRGGTKTPTALSVFGRQQMPLALAVALYFTASGDFEPLGDRFPRFIDYFVRHEIPSVSLKMGAQCMNTPHSVASDFLLKMREFWVKKVLLTTINHISRRIPVFTADCLAVLVNIMALHLAIRMIVNHFPMETPAYQCALALLLAIGEKRN